MGGRACKGLRRSIAGGEERQESVDLQNLLRSQGRWERRFKGAEEGQREKSPVSGLGKAGDIKK